MSDMRDEPKKRRRVARPASGQPARKRRKDPARGDKPQSSRPAASHPSARPSTARPPSVSQTTAGHPSDSRPEGSLPERISIKPATLLSPVPVVLVSCKGTGPEDSVPNLITLAWAGTICSDPPMVSISIRPSRFSHGMVQQTGEFVINLVNEPLLQATDYCGVRSGRDGDKFAACGLHAVPMPALDHAPAVAESPLSLGCKVRAIQHYDSHDVFQAEIVSIEADANLMDAQGKLSLNRCGLVAYAHGEYFALGRLLGFYGFSVASPDVLKRRLPKRRRRSE